MRGEEREERDNLPVLALSCVLHQDCNYHHQRIICREGGTHEHTHTERERERERERGESLLVLTSVTEHIPH